MKKNITLVSILKYHDFCKVWRVITNLFVCICQIRPDGECAKYKSKPRGRHRVYDVQIWRRQGETTLEGRANEGE